MIKNKVDPALPVFLTGIGIATTSFVFGMLTLPIFIKICVGELLYGVAKVGYIGLAIVCFGLLLEALNLYEHHRRHVILWIVIAITMSILGAWLIQFISSAYSC